jgi:hypothetical protein
MLEIPIISFVDFVMATGPARLTKVKEIKELLGEYEPYKDFYKDIREAIVADHRNGVGGHVESVLAVCPASKEEHFQEIAKGYRRFLRKAVGVRASGSAASWSYKDLTVAVNPELAVGFRGQSHLVKLYFKKVPLAQRRVDVALYLMQRSLGAKSDRRIALLDTRRARLYVASSSPRNLEPLLRGEAMAFLEMWQSL